MEDETTQQSRLFVILAIALIGLLVLGLLGIGGVFVIRQNLQEQAEVSQPTPTLVVQLPNPSPTFTPMTPQATSTPQPTPTNTPVVSAAGGNAEGEAAAVSSGNGDEPAQEEGARGIPLPQRTPAAGASAASVPDAVPETGLGALEAVLIAAGLLIVLFVARRMRMSL